MSQAEQLEQGLAALGIALPASAHAKLLAYVAVLYKWNKTYSLTAMREQDKAVSHHLLDSLVVLPFVTVASLLDVGSGGGMPGIPLAIARPELRVTLLDSNSKKTAFLQQAAIELALPNISVHGGGSNSIIRRSALMRSLRGRLPNWPILSPCHSTCWRRAGAGWP